MRREPVTNVIRFLSTSRHILTSAKAIQGKAETDLVVRIGEYDLQSDHNYLEAYKNYEIAVSKIHHYYASKSQKSFFFRPPPSSSFLKTHPP